MIRESFQGLKILRSYRHLERSLGKRVEKTDLDLVNRAFKFANRAHREQKRLSGEPYIVHPIAVAQILVDQGMDAVTIAAALLHDVVEDTPYGEEDIIENFGEEINSLVKSVTKISAVKKKGSSKARDTNPGTKERESIENIRLMLLATARDVRVILIKLADKLHNMRTLQFQKPESVERIANEVLHIYAPIAGRLGMFRIKSELEDLAFHRLDPAEYQTIADSLQQTRAEREEFITAVRKILKQRLGEISIKAKVEGRAKHIYSIHNKMTGQEKKIGDIYDLRGVRVIVEDIRDCYGALGIVHTLWPPIPGRFKDYIATPKVNGYQSLHTTVVGPDARPLEIQIRTREMDETADNGIAAHWIYKDESLTDQASSARMRWLKRLSRLMEMTEDSGDFIEDLRQELDPGEVYVFTPRGDVFDLPTGSTVLDFAFRIHTQIGLKCKGAKVNDRIVPLRTELKSGDRVEILTDPKAAPSPGWLRYIKSPRARQKLRSYFRREEDEEFPDELPRGKEETGRPGLDGLHELRIRRAKTQDPRKVPIEVEGARDIPVRYAGCCSPVPGDRIVGFVTRGRGVTVHRADCTLLPKNIQETERIIHVRWAGLTEKYPVRIEVKARDRQGLYLDLVGGITRTFTNILRAEADIPKAADDIMKARFLIEVEHVDHLRDIIESLESVPGVLSVERVQEKK